MNLANEYSRATTSTVEIQNVSVSQVACAHCSLFLDSIQFIRICVLILQVLHCLDRCNFIVHFEIRWCESSIFSFSFNILLGTLVNLLFNINFRLILSISTPQMFVFCESGLHWICRSVWGEIVPYWYWIFQIMNIGYAPESFGLLWFSSLMF